MIPGGRAVFLLQWLTVCCLVGCAKPRDYLYHAKARPAEEVTSFSHPIKSLVGDSAADIIWVIDNSASMGLYQQEVIRNTSAFMSEFTGHTALDWKIGLLSSDTRDNPYVGFEPASLLNTATKDPVSVFQGAVRALGIRGDPYEKNYAPVINALNRHPTFLRKSAMLVIIAVTDAYEQSPMTTKEFLDQLIVWKKDIKRILFYGAFGPQDFGCPAQVGEDPWNYAGSKYEQAVNATHGKSYILCGTGFGKSIADLGKDIVKRIQTPRLNLSARPVPKTLRVSYQGKDLPGGPRENGGYWYYDFELNALLFYNLDFAPGDNEKVQVTYVKSGV